MAEADRRDRTGTLLTPAAREWIGHTIELGPETVTARDVLRYLVATGAALPGDDHRDAPAVPPLFYRTLGRRIAPLAEREDDGRWAGLRPPVGEGQVLVGGIEVTVHRDLVVGDTATGRRTLVSLVEKHGRRRDFVLATWRTTWYDAAGDEVLRETVTEIMY
jgi:hydroxyacyl-ACP dehydratase HTD2-like protein with hotdog domain